jgi:hypothetical protein
MAELIRLEAYLSLERAMLQLDAAGDLFADALRDAMDPLWYELSDEDREFLDRRQVPESISELDPLRGALPLMSPPHRVDSFSDRAPLVVTDWKYQRAA